MSKFQYNFRIQALMNFNWDKVNFPPTDPNLQHFTQLIWAGQDDEGWCVFRSNPYTGEVVRIDFYPPYY